jgi:hypothetical protein
MTTVHPISVVADCADDLDTPEFIAAITKHGLPEPYLVWMNHQTSIRLNLHFHEIPKAIDEMCAAVREFGGRVLAIEPDRLITLGEMAHMPGLSWPIVHAAANGVTDGFPRPVSRMSSDRPLWDWVAASKWFAENGYIHGNYHRMAEILMEADRKYADGRTSTCVANQQHDTI